MMKHVSKMLLISVIVALGTTFSLNFFMEGFIITLSIILLPLLLMAYEPVRPLPTCLLVAFVSPGFRAVLTYLATGNWQYAITREAPSFIFYITYGVVYTLGYWIAGRRSTSRFLITVMLADFLSNLSEVGLRTGFGGYELGVVRSLLLIALIRTLIVAGVLITLKTYRSFLSREEHEARYRRILMRMASFKSEIYFMHMNMKHIESIMGKSFRAYRTAEETGASEDLRTLALDISKDVHEIKKDYIRVIKGLEDLSEAKLALEPMSIRDMSRLLIESLREDSPPSQLQVDIVPRIETDIHVGEHFYLMSVLRNLVVNAIEACEGEKGARVDLRVQEREDRLEISVTDNGPGIRETDMAYIFNPGFSTKYDPSSGDMYRGLGLTLVREMVENHFEGRVAVRRGEGGFTVFDVSIPKNRLEGCSI